MKLIKILIAEDDLDEQFFLKEAFKKSDFFELLEIVSNGQLLIETLKNKTPPDIILSDINMPLVNGFEALKKIKENLAWASIPYVLFTTCTHESLSMESYYYGADYFMVKPQLMDYDQWILKLKSYYESLAISKLRT